MSRKMRLKREGFTLVELLVVIIIIATLASLVVPAVTGALQKAKQTRDINNARQLGAILLSYANDVNDGVYPTNSGNSTTNFTQLVEDGYLTSVEVLAANGIIPSETTNAIKAENIGWDYIKGLRVTSDPNNPLLISRGSGLSLEEIYSGKAPRLKSTGTLSAWGQSGVVVYYVGNRAEFIRAKPNGELFKPITVLTNWTDLELLKP